MPDTKSYTDLYIQQQVRIENLKEGEARKMAVWLIAAHEQVQLRLERWNTPWQIERLRALLAYYEQLLETTWAENIVPELRKDGRIFTTRNGAWHVTTLQGLTAAAVVAPPPDVVFQLAMQEPFQGKLMTQWARQQPINELRAARNILITDWVEGLSPRDSARHLNSVWNRSTRDLQSLTRSYFGHLANQTAEATYAANDRIVDAKQWISTLDHRTSREYCIPRDNLAYTLNNEPINHSFPWAEGPGRIHWNCRSTSIPLMDEWDPTWQRPAVGAGPNYMRGDNTTPQGRVRKPSKHSVDRGILDVEQVNTNTSYLDWLKRQPQAFQEDVLGVQRAKDFREGTLTFKQGFSALNPTTVDQF
jgi:hypothetical protein